ncbi:hypothetical protein KVA01_00740 [Kocuria varians]|uniref:HTH tetR-type domain-containing protein n=1 Tax=Kocuria varians TaxID=1272 RepID=A0A4Y4D1V3_KOCVA|nr:TetR/AcrR family transcriptional regulator [Kocuria varians]GEC97919.1 hypothetical protein KVA01_00740 [Kocuria varians]
MSTRTREPAKDRILAAASRLFYARGMAATGIDAVTAEAGVAKMSLYNNFASKEDLVVAYIHARHEEWLGLYRARAEGLTDPVRKVLAVFDAYLDHAHCAYEHGFRGCGLLNAAAELPAGAPGREVVRAHKEQVQEILRDHLADAGLPNPAGLAERLSFLLEGAMTRAGLEGTDERLRTARALAADMLATVPAGAPDPTGAPDPLGVHAPAGPHGPGGTGELAVAKTSTGATMHAGTEEKAGPKARTGNNQAGQ